MGQFLARATPKPSVQLPPKISVQEYRVGTNLRPLPLESTRLPEDHALADELHSKLVRATRAILDRHGISPDRGGDILQKAPGNYDAIQYDFQYEDVEIVRRSAPNVYDDEHLAILISSRWDESSPPLWKEAVNEIIPEVESLMNEYGSKISLDIEIISTHIGWRKYVSKVEDNPTLERDAPAIISKVTEILESLESSKREICHIGIHTLGCDADVTNNTVMVLVILTHHCPESAWPDIRASIEACLSENPHGLQLWIEKHYIAHDMALWD